MRASKIYFHAKCSKRCTSCRSICSAALQWQPEEKDPVIHHVGHKYDTFFMSNSKTSTPFNHKEATTSSKSHLRKHHFKTFNGAHGPFIKLFLTVAVMNVSIVLTICMDIEPNPGPSTITERTSPVTRFIQQKQKNPTKVTRYKHHLINFTLYKEHSTIQRSLFSSLSPLNSINKTFNRRWNYISHFAARC